MGEESTLTRKRHQWKFWISFSLFSFDIQVYIQSGKEVTNHFKYFGTITKNDPEFVLFILSSTDLPKGLE